MRRSELATALDHDRWQCRVCQWRCTLGPGDHGRCLVRIGTPQGIVVENDSLISAAVTGPVEDHRLWHMLPGAQVLALGSWGYAFPADQARGPYARVPEDPARQRRLSPERAANFALERLCRGVVWTYSDPAVAHEYVLEVFQLCRASSRFTALVATGMETIEALDQIGHYLDAICLDLRGFDDAAYHRLAGIEEWRGILETVAQAKQRWNCHVEVITRMHPGVNDTSNRVGDMALWIRDTLGAQTPWHILPGNAGAAAAQSVAYARRIGHESGLAFIYGADVQQNTLCPRCGNLIIERSSGPARLVGFADGGCSRCGIDLNVRTSIFKR